MSLTVDYSQKRESIAMKRYSIRTAYRGKKNQENEKGVSNFWKNINQFNKV